MQFIRKHKKRIFRTVALLLLFIGGAYMAVSAKLSVSREAYIQGYLDGQIGRTYRIQDGHIIRYYTLEEVENGEMP